MPSICGVVILALDSIWVVPVVRLFSIELVLYMQKSIGLVTVLNLFVLKSIELVTVLNLFVLNLFSIELVSIE